MSAKLKIGIVGLGGRGLACFAELIAQRSDCELTAFCDTNKVRLTNAAKKYNVKNTYASFDKMLAEEKLDGLIITTPDNLHEEHTIKALEAGVTALVDKPLSISVKGCKNIIKVSEKSVKKALIGFNMRHNVVLRKIKELIDTGVLGRVFLMENREYYDGGKTYFARWNGHKENSGSLWIHKGSHDFDVFNWLLNFDKPVKVCALSGIDALNLQNLPFEANAGEPGPRCGDCVYSEICPDKWTHEEENWGEAAIKEDGYMKDRCIYNSNADTHDNGMAMVEYAGGCKASHIECFVTSESDRLYTVVGTKGQLSASLRKHEIVLQPRWSKDTITYNLNEESGGHGGADPHMIKSFVEFIRDETKEGATLEQGMLATAIGEAAELSKTEERVVYIDELMK